MNVVIALGAVVVVSFLLVFLTKRRFGPLALALAAGFVLSTIWSYEAGLIVQAMGLALPVEMSEGITKAAVILLPPAILLIHGPSCGNPVARIIGAALFALLSAAFLIEPLGGILAPSDFGLDIYNQLVANKSLIIGLGLILAIADTLLISSGKYIPRGRPRH